MSTSRGQGSAVAWRKAVRLLWVGQSVSLVGDQITLLALPLTAISLGADAGRVAVLAAASTAPFMVLGLPAGVWVTRFGLRRSMLFADGVRGLALLSVPLAAWSGRLGYPQLVAVALILGCAVVFFQVSYQSLTPMLVEHPDQLQAANTRLQGSESLAQVGGPALGGVVIGALGAVRSLTLDVVSYAASIATLAALHVPGDRPVRPAESLVTQIRAGVRFVRQEPALRGLLVSSVWFNIGAAGYEAMLVLFAVRTLGLSPATLGLAVGLGGLGVPVGVLLSGRLESRFGMPTALVTGAGLSAVGFLVAGLAVGPPAAPLIGTGTFLTAVGGGVWGVAALTTRQRLSAGDGRGLSAGDRRAMTTAVFRWATYSVLPLGALLAGATAATLGVRAALLIFGGIAQLCVVPLLRAPLPTFRTPQPTSGGTVPTIGVIIASTRPARVGGHIGRWVADRAGAQPGIGVDLIDLAELDLPFLNEEHDATTGIYHHAHTRAWSARVDALSAVILVTAEYNSSYPAPLKNALDYLHREWHHKPVGIVGYGGMSSGTRAVHALMPVVTHLGMMPAGSMYLRFRDRLDEAGVVRPTPRDDETLDHLLTEVRDLVVNLAPKS